jgi:diguanylate cyclase (GGDEF)-like protein
MLIYIVDDSPTNCEVFSAVAQRLGTDVKVISYTDPQQALSACGKEMPDLFVVDFMMPGMDGHELVSRVRALPGAASVPVVMITAATAKAIRHQALDLGVTDFLTKPVDPREMRARLNNLLELRRSHLKLRDRARWLAEEVRRATDEALHLANHDGLTGLPNRSRFEHRLEQELARAKASGSHVAVLCLDLDGFKAVNDTLGHAAGDDLLRHIAATLRGNVRMGDELARLGGDEFAVLQAQVLQPSAAAELAERLISMLGAGFEGPEVGVSVGIAVFPGDGSNAEMLMKRADLALYRAKAAGRGVFRFFEPDMDLQYQAKRALERDLHAALRGGGLDVHYQPQADAQTGKIKGFEALVRWPHPDRGMIPPSEFVPLAEECGMIRLLGEWVLRTACEEAAKWPPDVRLAVNLSPLQIRRDLPGLVARTLRETGFAAERLELEITEGVLIKDTENALAVLRTVKEMGVAVALDDFGTGYSSLSYLQRFEFDRLKIDRSFISELVKQPEAASIVRAILALTKSLEIHSTAEGVEDERQLASLRRECCSEVQGFLIGHPMPAGSVLPFLSSVAAS